MPEGLPGLRAKRAALHAHTSRMPYAEQPRPTVASSQTSSQAAQLGLLGRVARHHPRLAASQRCQSSTLSRLNAATPRGKQEGRRTVLAEPLARQQAEATSAASQQLEATHAHRTA